MWQSISKRHLLAIGAKHFWEVCGISGVPSDWSWECSQGQWRQFPSWSFLTGKKRPLELHGCDLWPRRLTSQSVSQKAKQQSQMLYNNKHKSESVQVTTRHRCENCAVRGVSTLHCSKHIRGKELQVSYTVLLVVNMFMAFYERVILSV